LSRQWHHNTLWEDSAPPAPHTEQLRRTVTVDAAIIGAGYTGLSAALHLAASGVSVVVLEAQNIGSGASGRNAGLVNPGLWIAPDDVSRRLRAPYADRLLALLGDAPSVVFDLIRKHDIQCDAQWNGTLHCASSASGLRSLKERLSQWQARGAPVKLLSASETAQQLGTEAYVGALLDLRAGALQPLAYARGLARAALQACAEVYTQSPVIDATESNGLWTVSTPIGAARCKWIIVATDAYAIGPWSCVSREQVELPYFNVATAPLTRQALTSILPQRLAAWDTRPVLRSFRLDRAGRLVFGSVGSLTGTGKYVHTQWAQRAIAKTFPQLRPAQLEYAWHGTIGLTADRLPRFHKLANHVIAFSGYNGRGIAPGTVFGRLLAQYILGRTTESDLPVPVSELRTAPLRGTMRSLYSLGSQSVHLMECWG
jgi:glycine/D-amino acid oxidase-like deaminating enzyme